MIFSRKLALIQGPNDTSFPAEGGTGTYTSKEEHQRNKFFWQNEIFIPVLLNWYKLIFLLILFWNIGNNNVVQIFGVKKICLSILL